jgi:hypothetical protein
LALSSGIGVELPAQPRLDNIDATRVAEILAAESFRFEITGQERESAAQESEYRYFGNEKRGEMFEGHDVP